MPQLDPTWFASQLFWLAVTFAALYFVLSRKVLPPLQDLLKRRQLTITGDIEEAQQLKTQAEQARLEYERMLGEARVRAQQIMIDAEAAHKAKAEVASKAMDKEVGRKLEEATKKINAKKEDLMTALKPTAGELTSIIVEKLTHRAPSSEQINRIIDALSKTGTTK